MVYKLVALLHSPEVLGSKFNPDTLYHECCSSWFQSVSAHDHCLAHPFYSRFIFILLAARRYTAELNSTSLNKPQTKHSYRTLSITDRTHFSDTCIVTTQRGQSVSDKYCAELVLWALFSVYESIVGWI